jgi:hypothetical protein
VVSYTAGNSIRLKPGFNTLGADSFNAKISKVNCTEELLVLE